MSTLHRYFATVPRNLECLLATELEELGAQEVQHTHAGVHFQGPLEVGYRATLWSRLANSILLNLATVPAATPEELYEGVRQQDWSAHMRPDGTLKVSFTSVRSEITHTRYGALKVKDAIVDQFRDNWEMRPSVDLNRPDLHVNCHVDGDEATLSVDLAGESLHRRGYRADSGKAPLKENVAAAVLLRSGWQELNREGRPLFDPLCGSGTLLIEGALLAADCAPGLFRDYFGFDRWLQHDRDLWATVLKEAEDRAAVGKSRLSQITGSDLRSSVLRSARQNAENAGLGDKIHFEQKALRDIEPPAGRGWPGLLVANAPYGERLGTEESAMILHRELGEVLTERFGGWKVSLLTGSKELGFELGLSADKVYRLYNGRLECLLLNFRIFDR